MIISKLRWFSNVWTGVVDKYDDYDLDNWPFGIEKLNNYYEKILKLLDYSELYNFITENKNPLNYKIKKITSISQRF